MFARRPWSLPAAGSSACRSLQTIAGTLVALRATDRFGRLAAIRITAWLVAQALVNIGGVVGVLPITGVPLPFVSIGGSALLTLMAAVGVLVCVARDRGVPEPPA